MKTSLLLLVLSLPYALIAQTYPATDKTKTRYENQVIHQTVDLENSPRFRGKPKNIILLIGDGMGASQVFAGYTANKGNLNIMNMPFVGMQMTQSANNYITDSAAGGTALSAGKRTKNGMIGEDVDSIPVKTILEIGEEQGKATGLVSTSAITHATPASFIAHQPSRNMYENIAADFLRTDIDVFIGGGKQNFDNRKDGINLLEQLQDKGYEICDNLEKIKNSNASKLAGFIADGHGAQMPKRKEALSISTAKALEILSKNNNGFFLMVEGSQIDWGGHANNIEYIIRETLDFDKAVGLALEFAMKDKNTLVIVTADHETGGVALNGGNIEKGVVVGGFTTTNHTSVMVPVYAYGPKAAAFTGVYKNTDVFFKMMENWKSIRFNAYEMAAPMH